MLLERRPMHEWAARAPLNWFWIRPLRGRVWPKHTSSWFSIPGNRGHVPHLLAQSHSPNANTGTKFIMQDEPSNEHDCQQDCPVYSYSQCQVLQVWGCEARGVSQIPLEPMGPIFPWRPTLPFCPLSPMSPVENKEIKLVAAQVT